MIASFLDNGGRSRNLERRIVRTVLLVVVLALIGVLTPASADCLIAGESAVSRKSGKGTGSSEEQKKEAPRQPSEKIKPRVVARLRRAIVRTPKDLPRQHVLPDDGTADRDRFTRVAQARTAPELSLLQVFRN
jgi:hypothetical protein